MAGGGFVGVTYVQWSGGLLGTEPWVGAARFWLLPRCRCGRVLLVGVVVGEGVGSGAAAAHLLLGEVVGEESVYDGMGADAASNLKRT